MSAKISQLFVYPIKSCAGISVSHFQFDNRGPLFDRRWMLVDAHTGIFLSQRKLPKMALISTYIDNDRVWASPKQDHKSLPDDEIQALQLPIEGAVVDVSIWEDDVQGMDCGDEAASWFSSILDYQCRLIYQGECQRLADTQYAEAETDVGYADGFPLLVVSQASIQFLDDACEAKIAAENFRPNIVIANTESFAELNWQTLLTNTVAMKVVKACQRCVIPALNPKTAEREPSILPVLLKHCRRNKKIYFGQNLTFRPSDNKVDRQELSLEVGQEISIIEH
ncbi:MAG: MOSC N-terminal beta barrel domain-containing protein [Oleispira sp.]|nr:MOSC N-terminal beta barrel domain-containing protein [Oleispira sp.]MBL4882866.1 MOSC N-terminal beta barrel domain-containing protein [Oleispira sp.]